MYCDMALGGARPTAAFTRQMAANPAMSNARRRGPGTSRSGEVFEFLNDDLDRPSQDALRMIEIVKVDVHPLPGRRRDPGGEDVFADSLRPGAGHPAADGLERCRPRSPAELVR